MFIHTVNADESIEDIAKKYGVTEELIREHNGIDAGECAVGEELLILTPTRTHKLSRLDTPERLSLRFGIRMADLLTYNPRLALGEWREGETIALRYDARPYGLAAANGYVYKGCGQARLKKLMPHLTYVTVASAVASEDGISYIFDHGAIFDLIREYGRIAILRVYSKCKAESFRSEEFRRDLIGKIIESAKALGCAGIALGGSYAEDIAGFLVELRKEMIGCDLILITEVDEQSPTELCDYSDGCVLSYAKYAEPVPPSFDDGEKKIYSDYAVNSESSKTFIELQSLSTAGDGYVGICDALASARRSRAVIKQDQTTLLSEFDCKKRGRHRFTSLKNIKAILDIINEYGFMGVCFDIMRVPENAVMLFSAHYKCATPPREVGREGCSRE